MIRLIASDIDGTLVPHGGVPSERTVRAIHACEDAGYQVVFVTGRPPRWMPEVSSLTRRRGTAICANGALTLDLEAERVLDSHLLPSSSALEAVRAIGAVVPGVMFAAETVSGFREAHGYDAPSSWAEYRDADPAQSIESVLTSVDGVIKLLANARSVTADELLAIARTQLDGVVTACHSTPLGSRRAILEMAAPGVTKAGTLAELCAARGIDPGEVMAFGDMPNDVDMLAWAGTSYAMADGHVEAKAAAGQVAPPVTEDGVAAVLESFLAAAPTPYA